MRRNPSVTHSKRGMATIEALPLIVIFLVLMSYVLGLWGITHTAILHSISARTYAFETFRNRMDLTYFRENRSGLTVPQHYRNMQIRYHAIMSDSRQIGSFYATARPLAIGREVATNNSGRAVHNDQIYTIRGRNREGGVEVSPAWVMVGYGICLTANCGGGEE